MNWERAKTLIVVFFLALNIMLAFFNNWYKDRYTLTPEQEKAIYSVFSQNKINWYFKIIRQYPPMQTLLVSGYHYETESLLQMFFPGTPETDIIHTEQPGKDIYEWENAQLVISNGYVSYDNPAGYGGGQSGMANTAGAADENAADVDINTVNVNRDHAAEMCGEIVQRYLPDYELDVNTTLVADDGIRLCYRQVYQKYMIYTNFIEFFVTPNGIEQIDMQYGEPVRFNNIARDICAPDEALLTFVQRIRSRNSDAPVIINDMDIVYYQEEYSTQENVTLRAVPYYRIFIDRQDAPFMINAYTNHIMP